MQIMGGRAKGIRLKIAPELAIRPATGALREAIFSHLADTVPDLNFADFFAGSGSYGLEAVSRGAKSGIFVEQSARECGQIRDNIERVCRSMGSTVTPFQVRCQDAFRVRVCVDLLFLDPPYALARERLADCFALIAANLQRSERSRAIFEMPSDCVPEIPADLECLRVFGKTGLAKARPKALVLRWSRP